MRVSRDGHDAKARARMGRLANGRLASRSDIVVSMSWRRVISSCVLLVAVACDDATDPGDTLLKEDIDRVMPAVLDARDRLVPGIVSAADRDATLSAVRGLVTALETRDGVLTRFYVREAGILLAAYRARASGATADGAEVSAIQLMLHAVTRVAGGDFQLPVTP